MIILAGPWISFMSLKEHHAVSHSCEAKSHTDKKANGFVELFADSKLETTWGDGTWELSERDPHARASAGVLTHTKTGCQEGAKNSARGRLRPGRVQSKPPKGERPMPAAS